MKCIDCQAIEEDENKARESGWGWSYGPEGRLCVCPSCLFARREAEVGA